MNKIRDQHGLTLVELLATLALMSVVITLAFSVLMNGIRAADNIQIETALRNEADYLMTSLIRELYVMKESEIIQSQLPARNSTNYYVQTNTGEQTGFVNNQVVVANTSQTVSDPEIVLLPSKIAKIDNGQYEITLVLKMTGDRPKEMTFVNVVRTIDDIKKAEEET